jgi:hypothetical protein
VAARLAGGELTVRAGCRIVRASPASYPGFFMVGSADGAEHLVRFGLAVTIALPATPSGLRPAAASGPLRWRFALVLRELARRREPVRVELADGAEAAARSRLSAATTLRWRSTTWASPAAVRR